MDNNLVERLVNELIELRARVETLESAVAESIEPDESAGGWAPDVVHDCLVPVIEGGGVALYGTNGTTQHGSAFTFASANDSKVVVTVKDWTPPGIEIGVYYV